MIDRRPSIFVQPAGVADVSKPISFAREYNVAGSGVCADGLAIDLSAMRTVQIDILCKRARVAGGSLVSDLDRETQALQAGNDGGRRILYGRGRSDIRRRIRMAGAKTRPGY